MKKVIYIMAALALISVSVQAAPKVEMKTSGPSGQGNVIWWAPSTGTTNLVMTTNGISLITMVGDVSPTAPLTTNLDIIVSGGGTSTLAIVNGRVFGCTVIP